MPKKQAFRLLSLETYVNRVELSGDGIYGWRQQWVA
jgi:hypothetical protein